MKNKKTLYDKIYDSHIVKKSDEDLDLIYIDTHFIHEVTSPQAFEGLKIKNRKLRRPDKTFATMDHNTPTIKEDRENIKDPLAKEQLDTLRKNCKENKILLFDINSKNNGIVHIVGPELGLTTPGKTIVCGDSHTATHGAFGSIAFGIGTSEVEHVFATQTIWQKRLKTLGIQIDGKLKKGVYAKDIILYILRKYGVGFGQGYAIEFFGETINNLSMQQRMTICNMSIEGGAKVGLIAPDDITIKYLEKTKYAKENIKEIKEQIKDLKTDDINCFDKLIKINVDNLKPQVTWGTNPGMGVDVDEKFPEIKDFNDEKAYKYMDLKPNQTVKDINVTDVFIGSCTNGRLEDLIEAAKQVKNKKVKNNIKAIVVPGSYKVKREAEKLGIDKIFINSGFQWREPGCSSCLGMNPDIIGEYRHCVSTSNRNFEGRQGKNSRTHLVSPAMAAACAVNGYIVDISSEEYNENI